MYSSFFLITTLTTFAQLNVSVPFEKWISLKQAGWTMISPDGQNVIYNVTSTNWSTIATIPRYG
ncbi:MAG: hypothetical protein IPJ13_09785 [Saprospiraceae bacterium]|nr:hypothetical protein [Saprospiraceae bacterium]